jgi:hypothetical protein
MQLGRHVGKTRFAIPAWPGSCWGLPGLAGLVRSCQACYDDQISKPHDLHLYRLRIVWVQSELAQKVIDNCERQWKMQRELQMSTAFHHVA